MDDIEEKPCIYCAGEKELPATYGENAENRMVPCHCVTHGKTEPAIDKFSYDKLKTKIESLTKELEEVTASNAVLIEGLEKIKKDSKGLPSDIYYTAGDALKHLPTSSLAYKEEKESTEKGYRQLRLVIDAVMKVMLTVDETANLKMTTMTLDTSYKMLKEIYNATTALKGDG